MTQAAAPIGSLQLPPKADFTLKRAAVMQNGILTALALWALIGVTSLAFTVFIILRQEGLHRRHTACVESGADDCKLQIENTRP